MVKATKVLLAAAALTVVCGAGMGKAAAAGTLPMSEWLEVMEMKARSVELQNTGAKLLDDVTTDEAKQRVRICIDDARVIFNICEEKLRD